MIGGKQLKKLKKLLGFNSPYSWAKWLIIGGALIFVCFIVVALVGEYTYASDGILFFIRVYGQDILLYMFIATLAGAAASIVFNFIKQIIGMIKTLISDRTEFKGLAVMRTVVMLVNFMLFLSVALFLAGGLDDDITYTVIVNTPLSGVFDYESYNKVFFITCAALIAVFWLICFLLNKRYSVIFKEKVVKRGFESIFTNVDFQPEKSLSESDVSASGLFGYNVFKGNDYLSAEYNGKNFRQSDVHLIEETEEEVRGDNGRYHTKKTRTTIFKGLFMIFDYDAISNERVAVFSKDVNFRKSNIETEFAAFNDKFYIAASDATEAFRILTPQVIEGIAAAGEKLKYSLDLAFEHDKLYVAVSNGNSFEANSYGNDTFVKQLARLNSEIQTVLDIIQILYLKK